MKLSRSRRVCAVTIATSDSGGEAGIQADLAAFAAHGVHGGTILVGATAQNAKRISAVAKLPAEFIAAQMDAVFPALAPRAVKIGALLDGARVRAVARGLSRWNAANVVLDPVLAATSGRRLLSPEGVAALKRDLLPLCDLATPNIPEAEILAGTRIRSMADRRRAALRIRDLGARAVLITGGHAAGASVTDLLYDGRRFREFTAPRVAARSSHGSGCALSSAIAANLALGRGLDESARLAIRYVRARLRASSASSRAPRRAPRARARTRP